MLFYQSKLKKLLSIQFVLFYVLCTFLLPMGNFSILADIPEMYQHCKHFEDKDMTPFDFITDHLICIDSLIDSHKDGDEQKPHQPLPKTVNSFQFPVFVSNTFQFDKANIYDAHLVYGYIELKHPQRFYKLIFHPPIV
jgi:hypothetical protein